MKKFKFNSFLSKLIKNIKKLKNFRKEIIINQIIRELINLMVTDIINTTKKNLKKINLKIINDIYKQNNKIVDFSKKKKDR